MFKKRQRVETAKKQVEEDPLTESENEEKKDVVEDLKEIQRRRKIVKGVRPDTGGPEDDGDNPKELTALQKEQKKTDEALKNDLLGQFGLQETGRQGGTGDKAASAEQKHLKKFLREKLLEDQRLHGTESIGGSTIDSSVGLVDLAGLSANDLERERQLEKRRAEDRKLFELPDNLVMPSNLIDAEKEQNKSWMTGLVEVEVAPERRIENMIAAEEAKAKILTREAEKNSRKQIAEDKLLGPGKKPLSHAAFAVAAGSLVSDADTNQATDKLLDTAYGARFEAGYKPKNERVLEKDRSGDDEAVAQFKARMGHGRRGAGAIQWPDSRDQDGVL